MMTVLSPLWGVGTAALLSLLLCFRQAAVTRKLKQDIAALQKALADNRTNTEPKASFSESLTQVERSAIQRPEVLGSNAEKYRYVASLAGQGVDPKGIAAALQMAPAEVEQLMHLARLKKRTPEQEH